MSCHEKIKYQNKVKSSNLSLGIVMVLFCFSNVVALREIVNYTDDIGQNYDDTVTAFQSRKGDMIADEQEV